ncbi:flagellar filament capping protein FliD [Lacrimispora sp.]|uniref:flagellar filament capping protein FliD n=1 Tax=Lacrimispora sp. TaxID=2719234 RepID=UPI002FD89C62
MASVYNSVTSGSLSSSIKGFGGLASGLDRDSLIEGMTAATRAKIAKQQKSKQTLQWKQDAYRSISSKLIEFSRKYTSYMSPETNISSPSFWSKSNVTPVGTNSKYVQVTGSPKTSESVSVVGVKQLASKASVVSEENVSTRKLETGSIDVNGEWAVNNLEGESLSFKIGDKAFSVRLGSGDYSTGQGVQDAINEALRGVVVGEKTLADYVEANVTGDITTKVDENNYENPGYTLDFKATALGDEHTIRLVGGSRAALEALGADAEKLKDEKLDYGVVGTGIASKMEPQELYRHETFEDRINGKEMTFSYNGVTKTIKLAYGGDTGIADLNALKDDIKTKLAKEFGTGRIEVKVGAGNKLEFSTVKPDGTPDSSSDLILTSADSGVIGKGGAIDVVAGEGNRLRMEATFKEFSQKKGMTVPADENTPLNININGKDIEGLTYKSTMSEIIAAINSSDAGVTVTYMRNADRFSIVSKEEGASGSIEIDGRADNKTLFGDLAGKLVGDDKVLGQDAVISVKYGDSQAVEMTRGSNSFDLDGLTVTVNGTFGTYGTDGNIIEKSEDAVTFSSKVDSDKIVKAVSDMIKDFNSIVKLVNDEVSTKPNRKYEPLTDEQKEEMKDTQIEKWEEEAKKGMLFGDPELRSLSDALRSAFRVYGDDAALLESIGITKSTNYSDNGALVFNEEKFRAGLETSGSKIQELFTKKTDATGNEDGLASRLLKVTDQYASTTGAVKGSLIEKAGSTYAPTSILTNALKKSMDEVDKFVERLQAQLKVETDRYVKQFTSLETVIAQMNSQSSWLQGALGG